MDCFQNCIFVTKGVSLLGFWRSHADYQQQTIIELSIIARLNLFALLEYESSI